jgi:rhodanese-related sulfurtransferase
MSEDRTTEGRAKDAHAPVPTIDREELAEWLRGPSPPALFEVLPRGYWRKHHLPGAISAPPDEAVAVIAATVPDRDAAIVVYCWDVDCPMSGRAARALAALGYTNVREYPGGKADWVDAGLPMERSPR